MLQIPFNGGCVTGEIVDILVPRGREYKAANDKDTLPMRLNFKVDAVCLQVGNDNKLTIVVADRTEAEVLSECFTTQRESSRLVFRVWRRNGSMEELVLVDDENAKNKIINIQAGFVRIIPSSSVSHELHLDSEVNAPVYVQIGDGNRIVIGPSDRLNVVNNSRPVLRALRMLPKEPILPVRGKSDFPNSKKDHLVVLGVAEASEAKELREKRGDYEVQVKISRCENGGKIKEDGCLFQKDPSLSSFREITGFWVRFQEPNARYLIRFSLWKNHKKLQTNSELFDETYTFVKTSDLKSTSKTHSDKENIQSSETERQAVSLPAEVNNGSLVLNDFFECCNSFMNVLLLLRDNGEWEQFDNEAKRLLDECKDVAVRIAIVLEQGMAARHRNELEVAEMYIRKASAMFPKASPHVQSLLKGRASCYLAEIYRMDKLKLGRAQRCVESAGNYLRHPTFKFTLDQGFLAYEEGCVLLEFARKSSLLEQAKRCFDRAYELCSKGARNNPFVRKHHLSMVDEKYQTCCAALGLTGEVFEGSIPAVSSVKRGI